MISIEKHEHKDGKFRTELCYLDSSGNILRRTFLDQGNELICDVLYEYDKQWRTLGGIVLNKSGDIHCSFESIYIGDNYFECDSIERDKDGAIKKRISYKFDSNSNPCIAHFFDNECHVGYCEFIYHNNILVDEKYFNTKGIPIDSFEIKSLWPI